MTLHFQCTIGSCHGHVMTGMTPRMLYRTSERLTSFFSACNFTKKTSAAEDFFSYLCRNYHWKSLSIFWSSRDQERHHASVQHIRSTVGKSKPKIFLPCLLYFLDIKKCATEMEMKTWHVFWQHPSKSENCSIINIFLPANVGKQETN